MYYKAIQSVIPNKKKYSRDLVLVCYFQKELAKRIGDSHVYISEFVVAKILGHVSHLQGHPEITKDFLKKLPNYLNSPKEILMRVDRAKERYLICGYPHHKIVLEIKRDDNKTQINTIHIIKESKLKRFRNKCISL